VIKMIDIKPVVKREKLPERVNLSDNLTAKIEPLKYNEFTGVRAKIDLRQYWFKVSPEPIRVLSTCQLQIYEKYPGVFELEQAYSEVHGVTRYFQTFNVTLERVTFLLIFSLRLEASLELTAYDPMEYCELDEDKAALAELAKVFTPVRDDINFLEPYLATKGFRYYEFHFSSCI